MTREVQLRRAAQSLFKQAAGLPVVSPFMQGKAGNPLQTGQRFLNKLNPPPGPVGIQPTPAEIPTATQHRQSNLGPAYTPHRAPYMMNAQQINAEQGIPQQQTLAGRRYGLLNAPGAMIQGGLGSGLGAMANFAMLPTQGAAAAGKAIGVPGAAALGEAAGDLRARAQDMSYRGFRQMTNPLYDRSLDSQLGSEAARLKQQGHPFLGGMVGAGRDASVIGSHLIPQAVTAAPIAQRLPKLMRGAAAIPGSVGAGAAAANDNNVRGGNDIPDPLGQKARMDDPSPAVYDVRPQMPGGQIKNDPGTRVMDASIALFGPTSEQEFESKLPGGDPMQMGQEQLMDGTLPLPPEEQAQAEQLRQQILARRQKQQRQFFPEPAAVPPQDAIATVTQLPPEQQPLASREFVEGAAEAAFPGGDKEKAEFAARSLAGKNTPDETARGLQTAAAEQGGDIAQPGFLEQMVNYFQGLQPEHRMLLMIGVPLTLAGLAAGMFGEDWLMGSVLGLGGLLAIGGGMGVLGGQPTPQQTPAPQAASAQQQQPTQAPPTQAPPTQAPQAVTGIAPERMQELATGNPLLQQYASGGRSNSFEQDDVQRLLTDYYRRKVPLQQLSPVVESLTPQERQYLGSQVRSKMPGDGLFGGGRDELLKLLGG